MSVNCVGKSLLSFVIIFLLFNVAASASVVSFSLQCPADVTITCSDDTSNLNVYGKAYIWEHNVRREAGPAQRIIRVLNDCGAGTIERIWEVKDPNLKIVTCSQVITITSTDVFGEADIIWPQPFDTSSCFVNLDPRMLKQPYDKPRFKNVECSKPIFNYKDDVFNISPTCKKILRKWRVIDCCQYDPVQPGTGEWYYYQVIKVIVQDTPVISCYDSITVSAEDCDGSMVEMDSIFAKDICGHDLIVKNNSKYAIDKGPNARGRYPIGRTTFYYTTSYACGKSYKCKVTVTVLNDLRPTPYCRNGLIVTLMGLDNDNDGINDEGMVVVWAKDLNKGSFHKCGNRNLQFSFSSDVKDKSIVYTCDSLGKNLVEVWVTDEYGNQDFCKTYIEVQNNAANIPNCKRDSLSGTVSSLTGSIQSMKGNAALKTQVRLTAPNSVMDIQFQNDTVITLSRDTIIGQSGTIYVRVRKDTQYIVRADTSFSDWIADEKLSGNGSYSFEQLPKNQTYLLEPHSKDESMKGIDLRDVYSLMMHLFGWKRLTNPYQYLAADINRDGQITNADYTLLFNAVLYRGFKSKGFKHWLFLDKKMPLDMSTILSVPCCDKLVINDLQVDEMEIDFMGVKIGDINFDVPEAGTRQEALLRNGESVNLLMDNIWMKKGEEYTLPIYNATEDYSLGQIALNIDEQKIEVLSVDDGTAICQWHKDDNESSQVMLYWMDPNEHPEQSPIAYMRVRALNSGYLNEILALDIESPYLNVAYHSNGDESKPLGLIFRSSKETGLQVTDDVLVRFSPNPFNLNTTLMVNLSTEKEIPYTLTIFNVFGQNIWTHSGTFDYNRYMLDIDLAHTPDNVLFYRLELAGEMYSGKLIHITSE